MGENKSFLRRIIFKSIQNGGIRSFVIFASILLGACVTSSFINVYADIDSKVTSELNSYGANVVISPSYDDKDDYISEKKLDEKLSKIPKLIASNKYLFGSVSIGSTDTIMMGLNFSSLKKVMPYLDVQSGSMITVDFDDRNILIGSDIAKIAGVKVGDEIEISTKGSNKSYKMRIRGVVFDGDKEDNMIITSLKFAQEVLGKEGVINYANAIIDGDFNTITKISKDSSDESIKFEPISKISKSQGIILQKIKLLMALISIVILIITSMCVNTSLSTILLSRIKEIALLRAIGASKKSIISMLGKEIFILALVASLVGSFLGFLLAQVLGKVIFDSSIDFRIISIIVAVILSIVCAVIASSYPIKKALSQNVANLLRGE